MSILIFWSNIEGVFCFECLELWMALAVDRLLHLQHLLHHNYFPPQINSVIMHIRTHPYRRIYVRYRIDDHVLLISMHSGRIG